MLRIRKLKRYKCIGLNNSLSNNRLKNIFLMLFFIITIGLVSTCSKDSNKQEMGETTYSSNYICSTNKIENNPNSYEKKTETTQKPKRRLIGKK